MHRLQLTVLACGLLLATTWAAQAGDEARAILEKAIKANQGKAKDEQKQAYHGKNKGKLFVAGLELDFTQEVWVQVPGKFKEVMDLTVMNQAIKQTTVFNGKEGWIKVNDKDIKVENEILAEFKEVAYMMGITQMLALKDKEIKLSLLGEVQVNGKPAVGVKISKEGKKDIDLYFDKTTGLMAKLERRAKDIMSGQEVTEERIVLEYQDVKDRKMPKKAQVRRDGKKFLEVEIVEVRFLEKLDDADFAMP